MHFASMRTAISKKIKRKEEGNPCCKEEHFKVSKRGTFLNGEGIQQRYIEFNCKRLATADCILSRQTVTIYENGFYSDISTLIDGGILQGDKFKVTITELVEGQAVALWSWNEWVDAADEEEHDYSGTDPRLASRFDEIDAIRRNLTCA